jgi:hypothetical protein
VQVSPKPHDCVFVSAPFGAKNCHYAPNVAVFNSRGDILDEISTGSTSKAKFDHDVHTGKLVVSYDEGKSWQWYPGDKIPDLKPARVQVAWSKVSD